MSVEELERRVQVLEDLEAIKRLKARYGQACDNQFNPDEVAKLYTEDGEYISSTGERYKGRDAIRTCFAGMPKKITFILHYFIMPDIEIKGSKAQGLWYMWCPSTLADGRCVWVTGIENDKYEKVNGEWLIAELKVKIFFRAPQGKSWE